MCLPLQAALSGEKVTESGLCYYSEDTDIE